MRLPPQISNGGSCEDRHALGRSTPVAARKERERGRDATRKIDSRLKKKASQSKDCWDVSSGGGKRKTGVSKKEIRSNLASKRGKKKSRERLRRERGALTFEEKRPLDHHSKRGPLQRCCRRKEEKEGFARKGKTSHCMPRGKSPLGEGGGRGGGEQQPREKDHHRKS